MQRGIQQYDSVLAVLTHEVWPAVARRMVIVVVVKMVGGRKLREAQATTLQSAARGAGARIVHRGGGGGGIFLVFGIQGVVSEVALLPPCELACWPLRPYSITHLLLPYATCKGLNTHTHKNE